MLSGVSGVWALSEGDDDDGDGKVCVRTVGTLRQFLSVLACMSRDVGAYLPCESNLWNDVAIYTL
jgi:hypothetical protein